MAQSNNNQAAFWEAMKQKYEKRNESLRQQEICLRERLEQLKQLMEKQQNEDDCDCVPEKLEKPSLVQCLVQKGKELILGNCKCGDATVGQDYLCACHIIDPTVPLNFDSNVCPNEPTTSPEGCLNMECDFYNSQLLNPTEDPSVFSLKTTDIYYMDKLAELVKTEKSMQDKIAELENKERSYISAIQDVNELMKAKPKGDPLRREFDNIIYCLEGENKKLKNELEDLRLELKHCFERVEGPLQRSLENQRDKCARMETKLQTFQAKMADKEDNYLKEINEIKAKLCQACCTMVDLNNVNSKLKNDLVSLENKCVNLEDELVKQQLKEAENILKFKNAICRRPHQTNSFNRGDDSEQDLEHIARKLSETLKEVYPCVTKVPTDLTETVKGIKQLTELVGERETQRRKKRNGKTESLVSQNESACQCSSSCSNIESSTSSKHMSSAPPVRDNLSEKQVQSMVENISGSNVVKVSKSCECNIEPDVRSQQTAKAEEQISKNVVDAEQSCSCVDLESNLIGPSEEAEQPTCSCDDLLSKISGPPEEVEQSNICSCDDIESEMSAPSEEVEHPIYCACDDTQSKICEEEQEPVICACDDKKSKVSVPSEEVEGSVICSCDDIQSKMTGPSEEVIVVKNLEPVCPFGVCQDLETSGDNKQQQLTLKAKTTRDMIDIPPDDIHVVTTLAKTGSLEITTEGPPGVIETKVNYLADGKIEIITKLIDRNKMTSFLDGTLLSLPEQPPETQCNESQTCGGQCDLRSEEQESQCTDNVRKTSVPVSSCAPYGSVNVNNNFVLCSGHPLVSSDWRNTKFSKYTKEEFDLTGIVFNVKTGQKGAEKEDFDDGLANELRLSSRPSLTNIDDCSKHEKRIVSAESATGFPHTDALETIIEGDEEESYTRNDYRQISDNPYEDEETVDRNDAHGINSEELMTDTSNSSNIKNDNSPSENLSKEEISNTSDNGSLSSTQEFSLPEDESIIADDVSEELTASSKCNSTASRVDIELKLSADEELKEDNTASLEKLSDHDDPPEGALWGKGDTCSDIRSYEQSSGSFCHLYRNFGSFNLLRGNFRLRQTKSLFENNGKVAECLRLCKSAIISLGHLKIDIEMIKFLPGRPNVGDFDDKRTEDKGKHQFKRLSTTALAIEGKSKNDEVIAREKNKEGSNSDYLEIVPDQIYQCYVCSCSKKDEEHEIPEVANPTRDDNLEERIDRLLQMNPFATSHDPDCECVNCLTQRAETRTPSTIKPTLECKCSKKIRGKRNSAHSDVHRCKCSLKKLELSTENELEPDKHGDTLQHDKNCTCVDCLCNPCNFKMSKSGVPCDCKDCECGTCYDSAKNPLADMSMFQLIEPPEITVMNLKIPCDCGATCTCDPCMDPSKSSQAQLKDANVETDETNQHIHPSAYAQVPSNADPFNNRDTWKNVVGCRCPPLSDNEKVVCDCKVCECKPCGYAEKARKPCDCKQPKDEPKSRETKGKCKCNSPNIRNRVSSGIGDVLSEKNIRSASVQENLSDQPAIDPLAKKKCTCPTCECIACFDTDIPRRSANLKEENPIQEQPFEKKYVPLLNTVVCDLSKCDCGKKKVIPKRSIQYTKRPEPEIVPLQEVEPIQEIVPPPETETLQETVPPPEVESLQEEVSVTSATCDCTECICLNCIKPRDNTENLPTDEKIEKLSLEKEPLPSEICHCSECTCDPCKNITTQTSRNVDISKDVPPEASEKVPTPSTSIQSVPHDDESPGSEVDQAQGDKTTQPTCLCKPSPVTNIKPQKACDCCTCAPCPDPNIQQIGRPSPIGDADSAKNEIMSVLNQITCTCNQAENDLKPLTKQASKFESTVSKMKLKLNNLQQKCKDKDQIINAMTKDLRLRSESGVFANLLNELAHPRERHVPDFNRTYVCDYLPKPRPLPGLKLQPKKSSTSRLDNRLEPILELDRYLPGGNEEVGWNRNNLDASGLEIVDIRRVTIDSILIKWRSPCNLAGVSGYQIFVNDDLKYKVLSPNRTSAVLDALDLSRSLEIMLFAMSTSGRCEPPALATYRI